MIKLWKTGELIENRYKVEEILTSGGMSIVYFVKDVKRPMRLAVKSLRPELPLSPQRLHRFLAEALIWADLGVDLHIVQAMSVSRFSDSNPLIFLEFVDGTSLRGLMDRANSHLPLVRILDISIQCCAGMRYVQSKNVVHRDLKPENILITHEGVIKITDFGIARAFREKLHSDEAEISQPTNTRLTAHGIALGTASYMSPEQLAGDSTIGSASDMFSFGVILYELITGEIPFRGETPSEVIFSQLSRPRSPSAFLLSSSFPNELDDLVSGH